MNDRINEPFVAHTDIIDNLKMDASILTPKQDSLVKRTVRDIDQTILRKYKKYIPWDTFDRTRNVENRIIISDRDAFETLYTDWNQINLSPRDDTGAFISSYGKLIVVDDPNKFWSWDRLPEYTQKYLISRCGDKKKAMDFLIHTMFINFLVHEVIHQYQNPNLSQAFTECAVRYYQRQIVTNMFYQYIGDEIDEQRINFYQQLIDKYGDQMHNLFFNFVIQPKPLEKIEILNKFDQETNRLFPNGQGLVKISQ